MLVEVHIDGARACLNDERIVMLVDGEDGKAVIIYNGGNGKNTQIAIDESYEDVFETLGGEYGEESEEN